MNRMSRYRFFGLSAVALSCLSYGQRDADHPIVLPLTSAEHQAITEKANAYMAANKVKGLSLVIGRNGNILYNKGFGTARVIPGVTLGIPVTGNTIFRLASVSKPVSAILAMGYVEQGKLDLEKATRHYFPQLPAHHTHKVKHIMSHMSGVRHYADGDGAFSMMPMPTMKAASALFWNSPLLFAPGKQFSYSTHAWTIFGGVLETVGGSTFANLLRSRIGIPQNLPTLRVENRGVTNGQRSDLFEVKNNQIAKIGNAENNSWKSPGGGMECSGRDLCVLGMKFLRGQVVSADTVQQMFTRQPFNNGELGSYGLGWPMGTHLGTRVASHNGEQQGSQTCWRLYPDKGLVIVVLSNTRGHDPIELAKQAADVIL